jgi:hypothetical protein
LEECADRLTLVEPEARDVDEADDVRCVVAESGDDLASVGVGRENGRAALTGEHAADLRDVIRKRGLWQLRGGDFVAVGLQALDHLAPARAVCPRSVDEDDIR